MSNTVVRVKTEKTPNPNTLKYNFSRVLNDVGTFEYFSYDEAKAESPLAARIMQIEGIESVLVGFKFIAITKVDQKNWDEINSELGPKLEEFFESDDPAVVKKFDQLLDEFNLDNLSNEDRKVFEEINKVINENIRPSLQQDGGDIKLVGYKDKIVYVQLQGACVGCPSASITLKEGVERTLIHLLGNDKIEKVIQV